MKRIFFSLTISFLIFSKSFGIFDEYRKFAGIDYNENRFLPNHTSMKNYEPGNSLTIGLGIMNENRLYAVFFFEFKSDKIKNSDLLSNPFESTLKTGRYIYPTSNVEDMRNNQFTGKMLGFKLGKHFQADPEMRLSTYFEGGGGIEFQNYSYDMKWYDQHYYYRYYYLTEYEANKTSPFLMAGTGLHVRINRNLGFKIGLNTYARYYNTDWTDSFRDMSLVTDLTMGIIIRK